MNDIKDISDNNCNEETNGGSDGKSQDSSSGSVEEGVTIYSMTTPNERED